MPHDEHVIAGHHEGVGMTKSRKKRRVSDVFKEARPTSDKVRSALLNILAASGRLAGSRFLDLFSGTGGVALAAMERGANSVLAVECDRTRSLFISKRFAQKYDTTVACCVCSDVRRFLPKLLEKQRRDAFDRGRFDIVFADPPYENGWGMELPPLLERCSELFAPGGIFVFERSAREPIRDISTPHDDRIYGDTILSFYHLGGDEEGNL